MSLNIELLKRLRTRFLRMRHKKHFNMEDVVQKTKCGAAMCIAGHALDLEGYKFKLNEWNKFDWFTPQGAEVEPLGEAQRLLGLSYKEAQHEDEDEIVRRSGLFFRFDLRTPKQAAELIGTIIETGKVLE